MKKISIAILLLIFVLAVSGCGTKKISYTEEFPYLPSFDGMKADSTNDAAKKATNTPTKTVGKVPTKTQSNNTTANPTKKPTKTTGKTTPIDNLKEAVYIIENINAENVLKVYEKELNAAGWKTITDNKPISIGFQKDNHTVTMSVIEDGDKVKLLVWSKE